MDVCWSMSLIVKASQKGPRVERNSECGSQGLKGIGSVEVNKPCQAIIYCCVLAV